MAWHTENIGSTSKRDGNMKILRVLNENQSDCMNVVAAQNVQFVHKPNEAANE